MANTHIRRSRVRTVLTMCTLLLAAGGLLAFEHVGTGAGTLTPTQAYRASLLGYKVPTTTAKHGGNDHGDKGDKHDVTTTTYRHNTTTTYRPTTTTQHVTTTTYRPRVTTTTVKPKHCIVIRFYERHGKKIVIKFHCRAPSGGTGPKHY